jgi:hypothetical protein
VGCNITNHVFALKIANKLKNGELKKWKIENSWPYLTILFASLLCFNKLKRAAVAMGRTSVCGLRYHWSRIQSRKGNLIEKKVSEWTAKLSRHDVFSPFFLLPCSVLISTSRWQWRRGKHRSVGCDIIDRVRSSQKWQFNCKKVSERTALLSRRNVFSPLFLPPHSVLMNERGRQWRRGEHWSVGCDIIYRPFNQKMTI